MTGHPAFCIDITWHPLTLSLVRRGVSPCSAQHCWFFWCVCCELRAAMLRSSCPAATPHVIYIHISYNYILYYVILYHIILYYIIYILLYVILSYLILSYLVSSCLVLSYLSTYLSTYLSIYLFALYYSINGQAKLKTKGDLWRQAGHLCYMPSLPACMECSTKEHLVWLSLHERKWFFGMVGVLLIPNAIFWQLTSWWVKLSPMSLFRVPASTSGL